MERSHSTPNSLLAISALVILVGAMLSGPVSTGIVMLVKPQPTWTSTEVFLSKYHWIQAVPFMLGFILLLGSCLFVAAASERAKSGVPRIMAYLALIATAIYAALISLNYVIQIAYVLCLSKPANSWQDR